MRHQEGKERRSGGIYERRALGDTNDAGSFALELRGFIGQATFARGESEDKAPAMIESHSN